MQKMTTRGTDDEPYAAPVRTPPENLDPEHLAHQLLDGWQLQPAQLCYAPVGFGSHHWIVTEDVGARWFVTVDDLGVGAVDGPDQSSTQRFARLEAAFATARALRHEAGLTFVVAPVPAVDGTVVRRVAPGFACSVFRYIEASAVGDAQPWGDPTDPRALVHLLARLHGATPTARATALVDDLALDGRADLERALDRRRTPWQGGPFAEGARALLVEHAGDVVALLEQYDRLASGVRARDEPWVITHGEPKADNVLGSAEGMLLVDWDTALLAPAARDLWMVDEGSASAVDTYTDLTGRRVPADDLLFYRLRWDLTDIASYAHWFSGPHSRNGDTEIAWRSLTGALRLRERWPDLF